jgi:hypothetical protein
MKITRNQITDQSNLLGTAVISSISGNGQNGELEILSAELNASPTSDVDVILLVGSVRLDPKRFFDLYNEQHDLMLAKAAMALLKEKLQPELDKIDSLKDVLDRTEREMRSKVKELFPDVQFYDERY